MIENDGLAAQRMHSSSRPEREHNSDSSGTQESETGGVR
jgi:hypothetical protein